MIKGKYSYLMLFLFIGTLCVNAQSEDEAVRRARNYVPRKYIESAQQPSVQHSKLEILQQKFENPHQVTAACLSCHTERHTEIMQTAHWQWGRTEEMEGHGKVFLGKKNALNNFCIGITGNEATCTRCHIGYGWEDQQFDFTDANNIDCLVCHDNSGTYKKGSGKAGYPADGVDLNHVAQHVGSPGKENCGVCHFFSAGGNNIKRGSLDKALLNCDRQTDVHMAREGADMACVECHTAEKHQIKGKYYGLSSENKDRVNCESCHTATPHDNSLLNEHTIKVACQTCHIPQYATANSTKTFWDWSTAGKLQDGKPFNMEDDLGNHSYLSIKGSFIWENNLQPEYLWFNGTATHYLLGQKADSSEVIPMNTLFGAYADKNARIVPVKIHKARQPYDPVEKLLIQPKLWDKEEGKGALWKDFDWQKAAAKGMELVGQPYSGELAFVRTNMTLPVNHMVAPASRSLSCKDCHIRENGRLAGLGGFYMPGRDRSKLIDYLGMGLILFALGGVIIHGGLRVLSSQKRKNA